MSSCVQVVFRNFYMVAELAPYLRQGPNAVRPRRVPGQLERGDARADATDQGGGVSAGQQEAWQAHVRARRQAQQVPSDVSSLSSRVHDTRNAAGPLLQQGGATASNAQQFSGVSGCAGVGCSTTGVQNAQMPQQCGMHSVPPTYMGSPANPLLDNSRGRLLMKLFCQA